MAISMVEKMKSLLKLLLDHLLATRRYKHKVNKLFTTPKNENKRIRHPEDLNLWERRYFSQNGEDGIIQEIFRRIGVKTSYYVEFGVEDGKECNTRFLRESQGWTGLMMDREHENPDINLRRESVTRENIETLFRKYGVPSEFDLLSIDIDSNDYYVFEQIRSFSPIMICFNFSGSDFIFTSVISALSYSSL